MFPCYCWFQQVLYIEYHAVHLYYSKQIAVRIYVNQMMLKDAEHVQYAAL
jgi:hypothetical protein